MGKDPRQYFIFSDEQGYGTLTLGGVICLGLWEADEYFVLLLWGDTFVEEHVV